jgi:hypothetical protein
MNVAVIKVGRPQSGKFSSRYQCVKVKDIEKGDVYTLNIGSVSSNAFVPYLKEGNVFFGVQLRVDNPKIIDVTKGFINVKLNDKKDE